MREENEASIKRLDEMLKRFPPDSPDLEIMLGKATEASSPLVVQRPAVALAGATGAGMMHVVHSLDSLLTKLRKELFAQRDHRYAFPGQRGTTVGQWPSKSSTNCP